MTEFVFSGKDKHLDDNAKVALCAVIRKLLVLAYGVLKTGEFFDPCYQK